MYVSTLKSREVNKHIGIFFLPQANYHTSGNYDVRASQFGTKPHSTPPPPRVDSEFFFCFIKFPILLPPPPPRLNARASTGPSRVIEAGRTAEGWKAASDKLTTLGPETERVTFFFSDAEWGGGYMGCLYVWCSRLFGS